MKVFLHFGLSVRNMLIRIVFIEQLESTQIVQTFTKEYMF